MGSFDSNFLLLLTLIVSGFMVLLGAITHYLESEKRGYVSLKFWSFSFIFFGTSLLTQTSRPAAHALSQLLLLPLYLSVQELLERFAKHSLANSWYSPLLTLAGLSLLGLTFLRHEFTVAVLPFFFIFSGVSLHLVAQAFQYFRSQQRPIYYFLLLLFLSIFFTGNLAYPFVVELEDFNVLFDGVHLFAFIFIAAFLPVVALRDLNDERNKSLQVLISDLSGLMVRRSQVATVGALSIGSMEEILKDLNMIEEQTLRLGSRQPQELDLPNLEFLERTTQHISDLVRTLKQNARMEASDPEGALDLIEILDQSITLIKKIYPQVSCELRTRPVSPPLVSGGQLPLLQASVNFLRAIIGTELRSTSVYVDVKSDAPGGSVWVTFTTEEKGEVDFDSESLKLGQFFWQLCGGTVRREAAKRAVVAEIGSTHP